MSKFLRLPFFFYIIGIFLIILYPPYNLTSTWMGKTTSIFQGWDFIWYLGDAGYLKSFELNIPYLLLEIGILTLCFGAYILGTKK